ncbi:MAG: hypothetical protein H8E98_04055 [Bacteroidetes bacterium]|nr:hypothetical protein [Bacteroidota bacterium]
MQNNESIHQDINSKVLIVDGLNLYIRCFVAIPSMNGEGYHVGGITGFLKSLAHAIRQFNPTRCIIVFDGKNGSVRRRKLYPDYKHKSTVSSKYNRMYKNDADEAASMKKQFSRLLDYLSTLPISIISIDGIEADDTIAYASTEILKDGDIVILSTDRDFLQLVDKRINVWSPIKKILYDIDTIKEEFGVSPNNFLLYKIFVGDDSDNIPGIKGVGIKTIEKRFSFLKQDKQYDIDDIINECILNQNTKIKIYESVINQKEQLLLNKQLMDLKNLDISGNSKLLIGYKIEEKIESLNKVAFIGMLLKDDIINLVGDVHFWLKNSFDKLNYHAK